MTTTARKLGRSAAAVAAAALIVAGTFSWRDLSQSKVNEFQGGRGVTDVVLVEEFEEENNWKVNGSVDKKVWVRNTGEQDVYVRLSLSEYLEVTKHEYYSYTTADAGKYGYEEGRPVRFAIDENGDYITCVQNTDGTFSPKDKIGVESFEANRICSVEGTYYLIAQGADGIVTDMDDTNRNGQIGKYMVVTSGSETVPLLGEKKDDPTTWHQHLWENDDGEDAKLTDDSGKIHDYVEWILGGKDSVMTLKEWNALDSDAQKAINDKGGIWLLDTDSPDGWAYYSKALQPEGTVSEDGQTKLDCTGQLLSKTKLLKEPKQGAAGGGFFYSIEVRMDAVTHGDLGLWFNGDGYAGAATDEAKTLINTLQEVTFKFGSDYYKTYDEDALIYEKVNGDGTPLPTPEYYQADKPITEPDVTLTPIEAPQAATSQTA